MHKIKIDDLRTYTMQSDRCEEKIGKCFFNYYNRANLTPLSTSTIQRRLESWYHPWKVNDTIKKMERDGILRSMEMNTKYAGKIIFYFPAKIMTNYTEEKKIVDKIKRTTGYIDKYSHPKVRSALGRHLHALVKNELRAQDFKIVGENTSTYKEKEWNETRHDIDLLAEHKEKQLAVGVEVKNELDIMDKSELSIKIKLCKRLGLTPVFACRWLEPYRKEIINNGGFLWQFKTQMYPIGFEALVKSVKQRFGFPVIVATEIPKKPVKEFEEWVKKL